MKHIMIVIIIIGLFFSGGVVYTDVGDFKKNVDKEQGENRKKKSKKKKSSSGDGDNSCLGECVGTVMAYSLLLWFHHNLAVHYTRYPYENNKTNNLVRFDYSMLDFIDNNQAATKPEKREKELVFIDGQWVEKDKVALKKNKEEKISPEENPDQLIGEKKNYFYTVEAGGQKTDDTGSGAFFGLRGRFFRLIGPECEFKHLRDGEDYLDYYAFGINIPLFQMSGIMPDFYIQRSLFRGAVHLTGWSYGFALHSYPVKPFTLMVRYGWRHYRSIKFIDMEGRVGVLLSRVELFGGYRYVKAAYADSRGPLAGIKIWI